MNDFKFCLILSIPLSTIIIALTLTLHGARCGW